MESVVRGSRWLMADLGMDPRYPHFHEAVAAALILNPCDASRIFDIKIKKKKKTTKLTTTSTQTEQFHVETSHQMKTSEA